MSAAHERTLQDQGDMYKSKLVIEYDKFDGMEAAYNEMKEINKKKTEELERSIEQRVEKIQREFDKSVFCLLFITHNFIKLYKEFFRFTSICCYTNLIN